MVCGGGGAAIKLTGGKKWESSSIDKVKDCERRKVFYK